MGLWRQHRIADVQVHGSYGITNTSISDGGSTAYASGVDTSRTHEAGTQDVPLVTVTVKGLEDGETPLDVLNLNIDDDAGNDVGATVDPGIVTVGDGSSEASNATPTPTTPTNTIATTTAANSNGGGQSGPDGPAGDTKVYDTDAGATVWFTDIVMSPKLSANVSGATGAGVAVSGLTVNLQLNNGRFRAEVSDPTASLPNTPGLDGATAYFTVETYSLEWANVDQVQLTASVKESAIPKGGVQLYHFADGEWKPLQTNQTATGEYTATASSFSAFAIGPAQDTATATPETTTTAGSATPTDESSTSQTTAVTGETTESDSPGFSASLALVAFLMTALALWRGR